MPTPRTAPKPRQLPTPSLWVVSKDPLDYQKASRSQPAVMTSIPAPLGVVARGVEAVLRDTPEGRARAPSGGALASPETSRPLSPLRIITIVRAAGVGVRAHAARATGESSR